MKGKNFCVRKWDVKEHLATLRYVSFFFLFHTMIHTMYIYTHISNSIDPELPEWLTPRSSREEMTDWVFNNNDVIQARLDGPSSLPCELQQTCWLQTITWLRPEKEDGAGVLWWVLSAWLCFALQFLRGPEFFLQHDQEMGTENTSVEVFLRDFKRYKKKYKKLRNTKLQLHRF